MQAEQPLARRMGIVVESANAQVAAGHLPVEGNRQPFGLLHGGASAALAQHLALAAAREHAGAAPDDDERGPHVTVLELSASHHRSVRDGIVLGRAEAIHLGRSLASYDVAISTPDGDRVCTARVAVAIRARAGRAADDADSPAHASSAAPDR